MDIIILAVIAAIIGTFTILGFNKGFLRTLVGMSGLIIGILFVALFGNAITSFVDNNTSLRASVQENTYKKLHEKAMNEYAESSAEQKEALEKGYVPDSVKKSVESIKRDAIATADDYVTDLSNEIANNAVQAAGLLLTILLSFIVVRLIAIFTKVISHVPILGGVNKLFGGVLGFARGAIIVCLLFYLITIFQYTDWGNSILETIANSKVLSFFYDTAIAIKDFFLK